MFEQPSLTARSWDRAIRLLRRYHRYEVVGVESFPRTGRVLVASTHSLATYENFMLGSVAVEALGRRPTILVDDLVFRLPAVGGALRDIGLEAGQRDRAAEILHAEGMIGLGPGGMREALRSSKQKYQFDWVGRHGFVWVAMTTGTPIILAACPSADDIFDVADLELTTKIYAQHHLPLPLFRGVGPTLVPRPVKVTHVLSKPILSDVPIDEVTKADVEAHHAYLCERMHEVMARAIAISGLRGSG